MPSRARFTIGRQHKMPAAIRAIDEALLVHREIHARMTQRPIATVAIKLVGRYGYGFGGGRGHKLQISGKTGSGKFLFSRVKAKGTVAGQNLSVHRLKL